MGAGKTTQSCLGVLNWQTEEHPNWPDLQTPKMHQDHMMVGEDIPGAIRSDLGPFKPYHVHAK